MDDLASGRPAVGRLAAPLTGLRSAESWRLSLQAVPELGGTGHPAGAADPIVAARLEALLRAAERHDLPLDGAEVTAAVHAPDTPVFDFEGGWQQGGRIGDRRVRFVDDRHGLGFQVEEWSAPTGERAYKVWGPDGTEAEYADIDAVRRAIDTLDPDLLRAGLDREVNRRRRAERKMASRDDGAGHGAGHGGEYLAQAERLRAELERRGYLERAIQDLRTVGHPDDGDDVSDLVLARARLMAERDRGRDPALGAAIAGYDRARATAPIDGSTRLTDAAAGELAALETFLAAKDEAVSATRGRRARSRIERAVDALLVRSDPPDRLHRALRQAGLTAQQSDRLMRAAEQWLRENRKAIETFDATAARYGLNRLPPEAADGVVALRAKVFEIATRMNPQVDLRLASRVVMDDPEALARSGRADATGPTEIAGYFDRSAQLIKLSLDYGRFDPLETAYHELWHSLESTLSAGEQRILASVYPSDATHDHRERMAYAFGRFAAAHDRGEIPPAGPLSRVGDFCGRLANFMRHGDFSIARDIAQRALDGTLAKRLDRLAKADPMAPRRGEALYGDTPGWRPSAPPALAASAGETGPAESEGASAGPAGRGAAYASPAGEGAKLARTVDALSALADGRGGDEEPGIRRETLAGYAGAGTLAGAFAGAGGRPALGQRYRELIGTWDADVALETTPTAFYTDPQIAAGVWDMLIEAGLSDAGRSSDRLRVLEPGCGTGVWLETVPDEIRPALAVTGVEIDPAAAAIARELHPDAEIVAGRFEHFERPDGVYDLVVGNIPFGAVNPAFERRYAGRGHSIHDRVLKKSADLMAPGGVMAVLASRYVLDEKDPARREELARQLDLVGAFRLPDDVMSRHAATAAGMDLLVLKRRDEPRDLSVDRPAWVDTRPLDPSDPAGPRVNAVFDAHPEWLLGSLEVADPGYAAGPRFRIADSGDRATLAQRVGQRLRGLALGPDLLVGLGGARTENASDRGVETRRTAWSIEDGRAVLRGSNGAGSVVRVEEDPDRAALIAHALTLHDAVRTLLAAAREHGDMRAARERANEAYDSFAAAYGPPSARDVQRMLGDAVTAPLLAALDRPVGNEPGNAPSGSRDPAGGPIGVRKSALLTGEVEAAGRRGPNDLTAAVALSLDRFGRLDPEAVATASGLDVEGVETQLIRDGLAYRDPNSRALVDSATYLSGRLDAKIQDARTAAASDRQYDANVRALTAALPDPVPWHDIDIEVGAGWIPDALHKAFASEILKVDPDRLALGRNPLDGTLRLAVRGSVPLEVREALAAPGWRAERVLETAFGNTQPTVRVENKVDQAATASLRARVEQIRNSFKSWTVAEPERRTALEAAFNRAFNSSVSRAGGDHLTFPTMSDAWAAKMLPHQKRAVWGALTGDQGVFHEVGAYKTSTLISAAIEAKRMGLADRPFLAVHKPTVGDFDALAREMYPDARIKVLPENASADRRRRFFADIAAGESFDLAIAHHEALDSVPFTPKGETAFLEEEVRELVAERESLLAQGAAGGKGFVKQLSGQIANRRARIEELLKAKPQDAAVYFEDLKLDWLGVDEAHKFKNVLAVADLGDVRGLPTAASQRATRMAARLDIVKSMGGKACVATATPSGNSFAEYWSMLRLYSPQTLEAAGVRSLTEFAKAFFNIERSVEVGPTGELKEVNRIKEFRNLPELRRLFDGVGDFVLLDDVPGVGRPALRKVVDLAPAGAAQREQMNALADRLAAIDRRSAPPGDNRLVIATDARKVALDARVMDASAPVEPSSKVERVSGNVAEILESNPGTTQLVFLDMAAKESPLNPGFSFVEALKERLVERGIPEARIADFFSAPVASHDGMRAALKSGEKWVGIGSTARMGTGGNMQDRVIAMHDVDLTLNPIGDRQRRGRGWRAGNGNPAVWEIKYVTRGTGDEFVTQLNVNKEPMIESFWRGAGLPRRMDDSTLEDISYDEMLSLLRGDDTLVRRTRALGTVRALAVDERIETARRGDAEAVIAGAAEQQARLERELDRFRLVIEDARAVLSGRLTLRAPDGTDIVGRDPIGTFLIRAVESGPTRGGEVLATIPVGVSADRSFVLRRGFGSRSEATIHHPSGAVVERINLDRRSPAGAGQTLWSAMRRLGRADEHVRGQLESVERRVELARGVLDQSPRFADQARVAERGLRRIDAEIALAAKRENRAARRDADAHYRRDPASANAHLQQLLDRVVDDGDPYAAKDATAYLGARRTYMETEAREPVRPELPRGFGPPDEGAAAAPGAFSRRQTGQASAERRGPVPETAKPATGSWWRRSDARVSVLERLLPARRGMVVEELATRRRLGHDDRPALSARGQALLGEEGWRRVFGEVPPIEVRRLAKVLRSPAPGWERTVIRASAGTAEGVDGHAAFGGDLKRVAWRRPGMPLAVVEIDARGGCAVVDGETSMKVTHRATLTLREATRLAEAASVWMAEAGARRWPEFLEARSREAVVARVDKLVEEVTGRAQSGSRAVDDERRQAESRLQARALGEGPGVLPSGGPNSLERFRLVPAPATVGSVPPAAGSADAGGAPQGADETPGTLEGAKSVFRILDPNTIQTRFADVIGQGEVVAGFRDVADMMRNPGTYAALGASLPKGIIVSAPPGNGKTLAMRALAGEAGVPVVLTAGPDLFSGGLVGDAGQNVRALYEAARSAAGPDGAAIIFIDEIDQIGSRADTGPSKTGATDEVINAFLTEMDGFDESASKNIILIGATNHPERLDPAFQRGGRASRHLKAGPLDAEQAAELLARKLGDGRPVDGVDPVALIESVGPISGADLDTWVNEAAIAAGRERAPAILRRHFDQVRAAVPGLRPRDSVEDGYRSRASLVKAVADVLRPAMGSGDLVDRVGALEAAQRRATTGIVDYGLGSARLAGVQPQSLSADGLALLERERGQVIVDAVRHLRAQHRRELGVLDAALRGAAALAGLPGRPEAWAGRAASAEESGPAAGASIGLDLAEGLEPRGRARDARASISDDLLATMLTSGLVRETDQVEALLPQEIRAAHARSGAPVTVPVEDLTRAAETVDAEIDSTQGPVGQIEVLLRNVTAPQRLEQRFDDMLTLGYCINQMDVAGQLEGVGAPRHLAAAVERIEAAGRYPDVTDRQRLIAAVSIAAEAQRSFNGSVVGAVADRLGLFAQDRGYGNQAAVPWPAARIVAKDAVPGLIAVARDEGVATVADPWVGRGTGLVALVREWDARRAADPGVPDPRKSLLVAAADLDPRMQRIAAVTLAAEGVPAQVLRMETFHDAQAFSDVLRGSRAAWRRVEDAAVTPAVLSTPGIARSSAVLAHLQADVREQLDRSGARARGAERPVVPSRVSNQEPGKTGGGLSRHERRRANALARRSGIRRASAERAGPGAEREQGEPLRVDLGGSAKPEGAAQADPAILIPRESWIEKAHDLYVDAVASSESAVELRGAVDRVLEDMGRDLGENGAASAFETWLETAHALETAVRTRTPHAIAGAQARVDDIDARSSDGLSGARMTVLSGLIEDQASRDPAFLEILATDSGYLDREPGVVPAYRRYAAQHLADQVIEKLASVGPVPVVEQGVDAVGAVEWGGGQLGSALALELRMRGHDPAKTAFVRSEHRDPREARVAFMALKAAGIAGEVVRERADGNRSIDVLPATCLSPGMMQMSEGIARQRLDALSRSLREVMGGPVVERIARRRQRQAAALGDGVLGSVNPGLIESGVDVIANLLSERQATFPGLGQLEGERALEAVSHAYETLFSIAVSGTRSEADRRIMARDALAMLEASTVDALPTGASIGLMAQQMLRASDRFAGAEGVRGGNAERAINAIAVAANHLDDASMQAVRGDDRVSMRSALQAIADPESSSSAQTVIAHRAVLCAGNPLERPSDALRRLEANAGGVLAQLGTSVLDLPAESQRALERDDRDQLELELGTGTAPSVVEGTRERQRGALAGCPIVALDDTGVVAHVELPDGRRARVRADLLEPERVAEARRGAATAVDREQAGTVAQAAQTPGVDGAATTGRDHVDAVREVVGPGSLAPALRGPALVDSLDQEGVGTAAARGSLEPAGRGTARDASAPVRPTVRPAVRRDAAGVSAVGIAPLSRSPLTAGPIAARRGGLDAPRAGASVETARRSAIGARSDDALGRPTAAGANAQRDAQKEVPHWASSDARHRAEGLEEPDRREDRTQGVRVFRGGEGPRHRRGLGRRASAEITGPAGDRDLLSRISDGMARGDLARELRARGVDERSIDYVAGPLVLHDNQWAGAVRRSYDLEGIAPHVRASRAAHVLGNGRAEVAAPGDVVVAMLPAALEQHLHGADELYHAAAQELFAAQQAYIAGDMTREEVVAHRPFDVAAVDSASGGTRRLGEGVCALWANEALGEKHAAVGHRIRGAVTAAAPDLSRESGRKDRSPTAVRASLLGVDAGLAGPQRRRLSSEQTGPAANGSAAGMPADHAAVARIEAYEALGGALASAHALSGPRARGFVLSDVATFAHAEEKEARRTVPALVHPDGGVAVHPVMLGDQDGDTTILWEVVTVPSGRAISDGHGLFRSPVAAIGFASDVQPMFDFATVDLTHTTSGLSFLQRGLADRIRQQRDSAHFLDAELRLRQGLEPLEDGRLAGTVAARAAGFNTEEVWYVPVESAVAPSLPYMEVSDVCPLASAIVYRSPDDAKETHIAPYAVPVWLRSDYEVATADLTKPSDTTREALGEFWAMNYWELSDGYANYVLQGGETDLERAISALSEDQAAELARIPDFDALPDHEKYDHVVDVIRADYTFEGFLESLKTGEIAHWDMHWGGPGSYFEGVVDHLYEQGFTSLVFRTFDGAEARGMLRPGWVDFAWDRIERAVEDNVNDARGHARSFVERHDRETGRREVAQRAVAIKDFDRDAVGQEFDTSRVWWVASATPAFPDWPPGPSSFSAIFEDRALAGDMSFPVYLNRDASKVVDLAALHGAADRLDPPEEVTRVVTALQSFVDAQPAAFKAWDIATGRELLKGLAQGGIYGERGTALAEQVMSALRTRMANGAVAFVWRAHPQERRRVFVLPGGYTRSHERVATVAWDRVEREDARVGEELMRLRDPLAHVDRVVGEARGLGARDPVFAWARPGSSRVDPFMVLAPQAGEIGRFLGGPDMRAADAQAATAGGPIYLDRATIETLVQHGRDVVVAEPEPGSGRIRLQWLRTDGTATEGSFDPLEDPVSSSDPPTGMVAGVGPPGTAQASTAEDKGRMAPASAESPMGPDAAPGSEASADTAEVTGGDPAAGAPPVDQAIEDEAGQGPAQSAALGAVGEAGRHSDETGPEDLIDAVLSAAGAAADRYDASVAQGGAAMQGPDNHPVPPPPVVPHLTQAQPAASVGAGGPRTSMDMVRAQLEQVVALANAAQQTHSMERVADTLAARDEVNKPLRAALKRHSSGVIPLNVGYVMYFDDQRSNWRAANVVDALQTLGPDGALAGRVPPAALDLLADWAGVSGREINMPEIDARLENLTDQVSALTRQVAPHLEVRVVEQLWAGPNTRARARDMALGPTDAGARQPILGAYFEGMNAIAVTANRATYKEVLASAGHELFHAIEDLFNEKERALLARRFGDIKRNPGASERAAEHFGRYVQERVAAEMEGRPAPKPVGPGTSFWDRFENWRAGLGFRTWADVAKDAFEGRVSERFRGLDLADSIDPHRAAQIASAAGLASLAKRLEVADGPDGAASIATVELYREMRRFVTDEAFVDAAKRVGFDDVSDRAGLTDLGQVRGQRLDALLAATSAPTPIDVTDPRRRDAVSGMTLFEHQESTRPQWYQIDVAGFIDAAAGYLNAEQIETSVGGRKVQRTIVSWPADAPDGVRFEQAFDGRPNAKDVTGWLRSVHAALVQDAITLGRDVPAHAVSHDAALQAQWTSEMRAGIDGPRRRPIRVSEPVSLADVVAMTAPPAVDVAPAARGPADVDQAAPGHAQPAGQPARVLPRSAPQWPLRGPGQVGTGVASPASAVSGGPLPFRAVGAGRRGSAERLEEPSGPGGEDRRSSGTDRLFVVPESQAGLARQLGAVPYGGAAGSLIWTVPDGGPVRNLDDLRASFQPYESWAASQNWLRVQASEAHAVIQAGASRDPVSGQFYVAPTAPQETRDLLLHRYGDGPGRQASAAVTGPAAEGPSLGAGLEAAGQGDTGVVTARTPAEVEGLQDRMAIAGEDALRAMAEASQNAYGMLSWSHSSQERQAHLVGLVLLADEARNRGWAPGRIGLSDGFEQQLSAPSRSLLGLGGPAPQQAKAGMEFD